MKLLVCGGRNYRDSNTVYSVLDALRPDYVIQGGATGADRLALEWALSNQIAYQTFEANWSLGRKAGPLRNARMLREGRPELVLAFPGGAGTKDMVSKAAEAGVPVIFAGLH